MPIPVNDFPDVPCLNYANIRSQIRSGDLLMCSGNSMFSDLIKVATGSIWSHIGFIRHDKEIDRLLVYESVESIGVRCVPLSFYLHNYDGKGKPYNGRMIIARHDDIEKAHIENLARSAVDLLGHQYGAMDILKITARIGLGKIITGNDCKLPERARDHEYICSEYVYECYKSIGLYINYDCRGFVAPADFAKTEEVNAMFCLS